MDYSSLGNDVGVSANTIKEWLSILEASFVVYKLALYFENFGKRAVKSPKYYFMDTGLLSFLLGIENAAQVRRDPLIGQLFENLIVMECMKTRLNEGKLPNLHFFRDSNGNEVDILFQNGRELTAIEIKSSETYRSAQLTRLKRIRSLSPNVTKTYMVYAGDRFEISDGTVAIRFDQIGEIFE